MASVKLFRWCLTLAIINCFKVSLISQRLSKVT